jgi:hypothetical protein
MLAGLGFSASSNAQNSPQIVNGLRKHLLRNGTSSNWSGYAAETDLKQPNNNAVSNVSGQWIVPTVACTSQTASYSSVWVGIDGYSDNSVEQTGTEQDCQGTRASYYAWYEMYPHAMFKANLKVKAGDVITASVQLSGTNTYTLKLNDGTTGKNYSTKQKLKGAGRQSAEWVAEAPSSFFGVLPLADFGTMTFTNAGATLEGQTGSISNWPNDPITMQTANGTAKATPSALSSDGTSFSDTWNHD